MEFFLWITMLGVALSVVGGILWWLFVFFAIKSAVRTAQRDLDRLLPAVEQQLRQAGDGSVGQTPQVGPGQQAQIMQMLMQAQNQMNHLNGLQRARYENRVADLMATASSAGIDWHPGNY